MLDLFISVRKITPDCNFVNDDDIAWLTVQHRFAILLVYSQVFQYNRC